MALSRPLYLVLRQAQREGLLPHNGSLLEFGEANWYGDMPIEALVADIGELVCDSSRRDSLIDRVRSAASAVPPDLFAIAKAAYAALFSPSVVHAIDLHGSGSAFRFNLNQPIDLADQYDVTINNGTAEHIFNIGQFFRTVHERTRPGGLMVHDVPFTGWVDHGFYTLQPTLFVDVAMANAYDILAMFFIDWDTERLEHVPDRDAIVNLAKTCSAQASTNLVVFARKPATERPFAIPQQGYYADTLTEDARRVWHERR
jgi:hypothetical protein